jgi:hypothetical protein
MSVLSTMPIRSAVVVDRVWTARVLGGVGVGAGFLFGAMSVWEHAAGLNGDFNDVPSSLNQAGFAVAMAGYVALGVGLMLARPGGRGWVGAFFPALIAGAWTALLAGMAVGALTEIGDDANVLLPLGGVAQVVGLLGLGITTAVARRWSGWRRFWALGFALFYVGALFVPAVMGVEPGAVAETLWALGYSGLGAALVVGSSTRRAIRVTGIGIAAGLVAAATVVTYTSSSDVAPAPTTTVVDEPPVVGSADSLERQTLSRGHYGSADSLERQAEVGRQIGSANSLERQAQSGPHIGSADSLERQAG